MKKVSNTKTQEQRSANQPISQRWGLTIEEAAIHFCIGENKLRELTETATCPFVLRNGTKRIIKRDVLEQYLNEEYFI